MKIACIDKTAADKLELQALFNKAFELCRDTLGYVTLSNTYPANKEDVLHGIQPDAVAIGPSLQLEDAFMLVRELRAKYQNLPILVFLNELSYNLRTLRRFQPYTSEVFVKEESPVRLIYRLSSLADSQAKSHHGTLITVSGVKGGVGTTSITTALAHSATSLEKSACIIDLSQHSCVAHFLAADRFYSADYASAIVDNLNVNRHLVERCIYQTQCGLSILLPPAGGYDIRELWLRNHTSFETTLSFVEHIREMFDVVFVDCANIEGILPFALITRADTRLVVTTNEPASVHLLSESFSQLVNAPGKNNSAVIFNLLYQNSLTSEDILDYLYICEDFDPQITKTYSLPFDVKGRQWAGSGNSLYTESTSRTQIAIDQILTDITTIDSIGNKTQIETKPAETTNLRNYLQRFFRKTTQDNKNFPIQPIFAITHKPPEATHIPQTTHREEGGEEEAINYEDYFESPLASISKETQLSEICAPEPRLDKID